MESKICRTCNQPKLLNQFERQEKNGKVYWRSQCNECKNKRDYQRTKAHPEKYLRKRIRNAEQRRDANKRARFILSDSRLYDRQHHLDNDLDKEFVEQLITGGCAYCGTTKLRIGLDRIDNTLGHLRSNVNAACTRCNFIRRDMPYPAWMTLVPSIRQAVENGLFGDWEGGIKLHRQSQVLAQEIQLTSKDV